MTIDPALAYLLPYIDELGNLCKDAQLSFEMLNSSLRIISQSMPSLMMSPDWNQVVEQFWAEKHKASFRNIFQCRKSFGGDPISAANTQLPFALVFLVFGPVSGLLISKLGSVKPMVIGTVVGAIGFL